MPGPAGSHVPVLLAEMVDAIAPGDGEIIVDGTFGRGGYATAFLAAADCRVIGIDCDPAAVVAGEALAAGSGGRFAMLHGRFGAMDTLVRRLVDAPVDGVSLDLGVSSPQLDDPARGFSFRADGPLDMRMDGDGLTAADVVNGLPEDELADVIYRYGEERRSRRVARAIVAVRAAAPITRTLQLAEVVRGVVPKSRDGLDPATRTFQALRIHVNDELGDLDRGLSAAERLLRPGGRLAVVSFHSLEDRRVKRFLSERSGTGPGVSRHQPAPRSAPGAPTFRLPRRKPVTPGRAEQAANARARSARLRAAIRTEAAAWTDGGVAA
ncbi:MAG: 16S rRNA (cytosine(1402)-N(4))-methyltransferase RsmH [Alphaproteobacteria bacterium]